MKKMTLSYQSLEPVYKAIENLDRTKRFVIYGVSILILVAGFGAASFYPMYNDITRFQNEFDSTQAKLTEAKKKADQLESLQNERKMKEMEFKISMKALPEKKEIPALLTSISQSGQDTGVEFLSFEPKAETPKDFYAEIPVEMEMVGGFHNMVMFFDKVTSLNRIVNIRNIQLSTSGSTKDEDRAKLKVKCQAITYKFNDPGVAPDPNKATAPPVPSKPAAPAEEALSKKK